MGRNMAQSIAHWFNRRSMQSRLVAAYIVILLLPSLLVSNYLFSEIRESYGNDTLKQAQYSVEMERVNIRNQIEAMERAAQLTISDSEIIDYISREEELPVEDLLELYRGPLTDMINIQINNPNIVHLRLFSNNRYLSEVWPIVFHERRIQKEPWYKQLEELNGKELWLFKNEDPDILHRNVTDGTNQMPKVSLMRVIEAGGKRVGVIEVSMLLKQFSPKAFASIKDEGSQMMIADRNGTIFMDEQQSFAGDNLELRDALLETFGKMEQQQLSEMRFVVGQQPYLLVSAPLEQANAYILNLVSLQAVSKDISKAQAQIIGFNVIIITLLSVITYWLNAIILKNLRRLTEAMKKVRRGEMPTGLPLSGGGEIGELAHHFNKMIHTINELIAQGVKKQALTKEAELRTLHSQIDSHFLYNTLENIKMLAEMEDQRTISDSLTSLGGMMRYNFKWSGEYVSLQDEIRHIQNYIAVMNIRFDEPIALELHIPPGLMEIEVLKMSLQPIVENAVKHAWSGTEEEQSVIRIEVAEGKGSSGASDSRDGGIIITLRDNGMGIGEERLQRLNEWVQSGHSREMSLSGPGNGQQAIGIGLRNVHERIRLYYGEPYGLRIYSVEGQFTEVVITLPKVLLMGGSSGYEKNADRR
ncbi:sensor histidine kinase [Paenibacillus radicis (ex Gao et al. 2016)]|uniref:histidine kinase n=1 Tax=Paenibacillus radicis (ex Gao et al. 2016) TaxID=1737354 RepID=A0A917HNT7_9BACL|nr:sensor histidine kinase [Paenibacillus radicis (ex Gao et al. 2016)]GGG85457.1 sensor histidine kinase YesM [Paenibacillus radicis (ex Gao et al. 2016)]